jgi:hydrogenase maturation protease
MRDALPEAGHRPRLIVIGVGNSWRGDDGAGLAVARRVGGLEHEGDCMTLLDAWEPGDDVTIVDAASSGARAGTIHRLDPLAQPLPTGLLSSSTHAFGVPDAVELARALGRLPHALRVYGIEGENFEAGTRLSAAVERAVRELSGELRRTSS